MLYLSRKIGESIIINDDIEIKVVEVRGRTVKLGFTYPPTATVLRKEIHERVVSENMEATKLVKKDPSKENNNEEGMEKIQNAFKSLTIKGKNRTKQED